MPDPTVSQGDHRLLATEVPQSEHGAVALEQWQTFIQQHRAQLRHAPPRRRRSRIHGAGGVLIRAAVLQLRLSAAEEPFQPTDCQLTRLRYLSIRQEKETSGGVSV